MGPRPVCFVERPIILSTCTVSLYLGGLTIGGGWFSVAVINLTVIPCMSLPAGMNSILIYVGHEVLGGYFPFQWPHQEDNHLIFLSANLVAIGLWMLIAFYCYLIGFYVKI